MKGRFTGFTLLEILVVLAIVGLLLGLFGTGLLRSIRSAELREAANAVAADFRRARSTAQRGSTDVQAAWTPGADGKFTSYSVNGQVIQVSHRVKLSCLSGCDKPDDNVLTYTAPYGELGDAIGKVLVLESPMTGIAPLQVRIVGVTGKVIVTRGS